MDGSIRLLRGDDDLIALTEMIHRAYAPLAAAGLRYWATHQSVADTRERVGRGETWVVERGGRICATITLQAPDRTSGAPFYDRPTTAKIQQLCVDPAHQGDGLAGALMARAEARAEALGARHLALDTSEHAEQLIATYQRRGYRIVEHVDWRPAVNYRSVILALALPRRELSTP